MRTEVVNMLFEPRASDLLPPPAVPLSLRDRYSQQQFATVCNELPARRAFADVTNVSQERSTHHRGSWAQGRTQQMKRGTPEDRTFVGDCSLSARQREVSVLEKLREWRLRRGCALQLALREHSIAQAEQSQACLQRTPSPAAGSAPASPPEQLFTPGSQPEEVLTPRPSGLDEELSSQTSTSGGRRQLRLRVGTAGAPASLEGHAKPGSLLEVDTWHTPPSSSKPLDGTHTPTSVLSSRTSSAASQAVDMPGIQEQQEWPVPTAPMYVVAHDRLGEGGCAVVHRCRKADDHTYRFAAKVITYGPSNCRDNLEAIFDEINIMRERASGLPHVIELQDFAFDDETMEAYLIFRLLQGCTLEELKEQRWFHSMPIPRREGVVREMARQLFQALSDLHRRGAYHCDVKGANVFLSLAAPPARPGTLDLQLIDFGLAERCEAGQHVRMIGGTPAYMPPEIAKARIRALLGKRVVLVNPAAADVYSAAITLFEACFGCVPFWVTESQEMSQLKELRLLQKWALCEPKPWSCKRLPMHDMHLQLRELSPAAQDFFAQAMCADPAARLTMSQALEHDFLQADSNCLVPEAFLAGFGTLQ